MNEDVLNMSTRKFLKKVGVTSQREIEAAVRSAADAGAVPDGLEAEAVVSIPKLGIEFTVTAPIETS